MRRGFEPVVRDLFEAADIRIGGDRPWDPTVRDPRFYQRLMADGTLGLGESYMDGWWDCDRVDEMMARLSGPRLANR